jgi:hypothetical protein
VSLHVSGGNPKSKNSHEYAQKPQRNCTFMNSTSALERRNVISVNPGCVEHQFFARTFRLFRIPYHVTGTRDWNTWLEHVAGTRDWNTWLEHVAGTRDWNTWLEHVAGTRDWNTWLEHVAGTRGCNTWLQHVTGPRAWPKDTFKILYCTVHLSKKSN